MTPPEKWPAIRQEYLEYTRRHADVYLEMLSALECAETVLILLKDEASALGCHGKDVLPKVQQAIVHARGL